ncbi:non-specific lipid transfer protein GPI-anchored 6-like [Tasmannia lanceolata]|uniref:non-specific lipid transfer protein GPI-anchored 6-like n=1 Tax=Tasmannia lanceolata TaxID=3420 RepID=UPI004064252A
MAKARGLPAVGLSSIIVLLLIGFARSDVASDRAECADSLVGLATCLPYVQGNAKAPTPDCCTGLKTVLDKSKKCLCILIKDRDDPQLGIKINASLAVNLPTACSSPVNITQCIDLLHLAPGSSEAKVFTQFTTTTNSTTTGGKGNSTVVSSPSSSSRTTGESNGVRSGQRWGVREMVVGVWIWCFVWLLMLGG